MTSNNHNAKSSNSTLYNFIATPQSKSQSIAHGWTICIDCYVCARIVRIGMLKLNADLKNFFDHMERHLQNLNGLLNIFKNICKKCTIASEPWLPNEVGHRTSLASIETIFRFSSIFESDIAVTDEWWADNYNLTIEKFKIVLVKLRKIKLFCRPNNETIVWNLCDRFKYSNMTGVVINRFTR